MKEITDAPVEALEAVAAGDVGLVAKGVRHQAMRDLGPNKHFLTAQTISVLAVSEE